MKINEIELSCILAEQKLEEYARKLSRKQYEKEFPNGFIVFYDDEGDYTEESRYTEEAQEIFDTFYVEYLTIIENCKL